MFKNVWGLGFGSNETGCKKEEGGFWGKGGKRGSRGADLAVLSLLRIGPQSASTVSGNSLNPDRICQSLYPKESLFVTRNPQP